MRRRPNKKPAGAGSLQNVELTADKNTAATPSAQVIRIRQWLVMTARGRVISRHRTQRAAEDAAIFAGWCGFNADPVELAGSRPGP